MSMLNLRKISELVEVNKKLKECLKRSSDLLAKAYGIIEKQNNMIKYYEAALHVDTFQFPEERGLGEGDTPTDLSPLDL